VVFDSTSGDQCSQYFFFSVNCGVEAVFDQIKYSEDNNYYQKVESRGPIVIHFLWIIMNMHTTSISFTCHVQSWSRKL
jgi:hypothetical protein